MNRLLFVACALVWAWPAVGEQGAKQPMLTMQVATHLVQVNVTVLDHEGKPVTGLSRDDFRVFDAGKPQTIAIFRVESNRPPASAPKLPSNAFSNYAERAESVPPSVTVILLDALNTDMAAQIYARQQVVKFLEQVMPGDHVALYALTDRLMVLHDFTSDSSALVEALRHYHGRYVSEVHSGEPSGGSSGVGVGGKGSSGTASESAQLDQWLGDVEGVSDDYYAKQRVRVTTDALVAIADHLAGLPGRKNLVWVSGGFPLWNELNQTLVPNGFTLPQDLRSMVTRAARAINDVNLAIDPVDARGLMAEPGISVVNHGVPAVRMPASFDEGFAIMDDLAQRTGGRAFYNTNGIRQSIRRVVDDASVTYLLGYYPEGVKWQGEFRSIKVRVARRGVKLQYRRGYSATPDERAPAGERTPSLDAVVDSPLDATAIGLAVQVLPDNGASTAGGSAYLTRLQIDPREITFEQQGRIQVASLTLVTDEFGPLGRNLKGVVQKLQIRLEPEVYQKALSEREMGFGERLLIPILFNAERLRVVIRDDPTGRMGSVNVPLDRGFRPAKPFFAKRNPSG